MSKVRQLQRAREAKKQAVASVSRGFNFEKIKFTDLDSINIDTGEEVLTVSMLLPVGGGEAFAEYEETLDLEEAPGYLRHAAREMAKAVFKAVQERALLDEPLLCETCNGNCCRNSKIQLTDADVKQLMVDGVDPGSIQFLEDTGILGHVAEFVVVEAWDNPNETVCFHLRADGCSIYENRPTICREYSAWSCDAYVEDADKKAGKIHLRVVKGDDATATATTTRASDQSGDVVDAQAGTRGGDATAPVRQDAGEVATDEHHPSADSCRDPVGVGG